MWTRDTWVYKDSLQGYHIDHLRKLRWHGMKAWDKRTSPWIDK